MRQERASHAARKGPRRFVFAAVLAVLTFAVVAAVAAWPSLFASDEGPRAASAETPQVHAPQVAALQLLAGREAVMHRSPSCGCCGGYAEHLRELGVQVEEVETDRLDLTKVAYGVPPHAASCHTMTVAGYVVEGHVPMEALADLLRERPAIDGIALAGMPVGTPGMPGPSQAPFQVLALDRGTVAPFGAYD